MTAPVNRQTVILGYPGGGKSTLARELASGAVREGFVVLVHDPHREFSQAVGPHYPTVEEYERAYEGARSGKAPLALGASIGGMHPDPVFDLAIRVARVAGRPVCVVADEMALTERSGTTHVCEEDKFLLTNRRHVGRGIWPILLAQDTGVMQALWLRFATEVYLFRMPDERRLREVEAKVGVVGLVERVPRLRPFQHLRIEPGDDLRGEQ